MNEHNVDKYPWSIVMPYLIDIILFLSLVIFALASYSLTLHRIDGEIDWFQRGGSLIVLISAILEYRHLNIYSKDPTHISVISGEFNDVKCLRVLSKIRINIGRFGIIYLVLGTIIWGYGDIPFK